MPELLTLGHDVIYKGHAQNHTQSRTFTFLVLCQATLSQPIWPAATNWTHLPEHNMLVTKCLPGSFLNQNSDTYIKVTWKYQTKYLQLVTAILRPEGRRELNEGTQGRMLKPTAPTMLSSLAKSLTIP